VVVSDVEVGIDGELTVFIVRVWKVCEMSNCENKAVRRNVCCD
jgi:hypothetical protein